MAGLVDHEAVLVDFEAFLVSDGRSSHGTDFLTRKLAELRAKHRIDESAEAATLRHFGAHVTDTFLGLLPAPPATGGPLAQDDPRTSEAMAAGTATPSPSREDTCQTAPAPLPLSRRMPDSRLADLRTERVPAPATSS